MQDPTVLSHDFHTLGPAPITKRGCLTTHLVVLGIGAVMGAVVHKLIRQERPGLVPVGSLLNSTIAHNAATLSGERFSADGPGGNVLISYWGQRPQQNRSLTTIPTAETFELSFDITPHAAAPSNLYASIVHFGFENIQRFPAFWLISGTTRLYVSMDGQEGGGWGHEFTCGPEEALPVGQVTHVIFRLEGASYTVFFNGQPKCTVGGFSGNRVPALPSVDVWFSDPWYPAADVTVANLRYTSLYECGPIG